MQLQAKLHFPKSTTVYKNAPVLNEQGAKIGKVVSLKDDKVICEITDKKIQKQLSSSRQSFSFSSSVLVLKTEDPSIEVQK